MPRAVPLGRSIPLGMPIFVRSLSTDPGRQHSPPVPWVPVDERKVGRAYGVDGLIGLSYSGGSYALVVDVKANGAPRFARSGVYRLESCVARLLRPSEANGGRRRAMVESGVRMS